MNVFMRALLSATCLLAWVAFADANPEEANVLYYYCERDMNYLDGQPLINQVNVLRIIPNIEIPAEVDTVEVTLFIGCKRYRRSATAMDGKRFWQSSLPAFKLGDAIQRIEVRMGIPIGKTGLLQAARTLEMDSLNTSIEGGNRKTIDILDSLRKKQKPESGNLDNIRQELIQLALLPSDSGDIQQKYLEIANQIQNLPKEPGADRAYSEVRKLQSQAEFAKDSLQPESDFLLRRYADRIDSAYSALVKPTDPKVGHTPDGAAPIKEAGAYIDYQAKFVWLKFSNSRPGLRKLVAQDPGEKMGIFRARYIPFSVVGGNQIFPNSPPGEMMFEFGFNFGDATFAGDGFIVPELSIKRLGVAFSVSPQLFKGRHIALALTYDVNSYSSIGVGIDFRVKGLDSAQVAAGQLPDSNNRERALYLSLGINQRAFQDLLGQVNRGFR